MMVPKPVALKFISHKELPKQKLVNEENIFIWKGQSNRVECLLSWDLYK